MKPVLALMIFVASVVGTVNAQAVLQAPHGWREGRSEQGRSSGSSAQSEQQMSTSDAAAAHDLAMKHTQEQKALTDKLVLCMQIMDQPLAKAMEDCSSIVVAALDKGFLSRKEIAKAISDARAQFDKSDPKKSNNRGVANELIQDELRKNR